MQNHLINYLQMFRPVSKEDSDLISSVFEYKTYNEGDYLFKNNQVCRELFFIAGGVLKIVANNDKGTEATYFFLKENQFCTILNSFNNQVISDEGIQAACPASVYGITKIALMDLYEQLPWLKTLINQITQQALLDKIQIRNSYLGLDSTARYQLFMMRQPDIAMRVQLTDVASYLGITPQSLSRIRKNMR
jgi:CRP-like cAMP-binding protein